MPLRLIGAMCSPTVGGGVKKNFIALFHVSEHVGHFAQLYVFFEASPKGLHYYVPSYPVGWVV